MNVAGETSIPSSRTAFALVNGDKSAWPLLVRDMVGRGALIGLGVAIAGGTPRQVLRFGLAGSICIEAFVLGYAAYQTREPSTPPER